MAGALSAVESIDGDSLYNAANVVASLPAVAECSDIEVLSAQIPVPRDPAVAERVRDLRRRLIDANVLESAGRYPEALDAVNEVIADLTDASPAGERDAALSAVLAEATLASGRISLMDRRLSEAVAPLQQALTLSLEYDLLPSAVEAAARLFYVQGMRGLDLADIASRAALIEPLSQNLAASEFARPLLLNNLGAVYMARREPQKARTYFEAARTAMAHTRDRRIELINVLSNLAMVTARYRRSSAARPHRLAIAARGARRRAPTHAQRQNHPGPLHYARHCAHARNPRTHMCRLPDLLREREPPAR